MISRRLSRRAVLFILAALQLISVGAGPFDWVKSFAKALRGRDAAENEGAHTGHAHRSLLSAHTMSYSSISPTAGLALGWETITVRGLGFEKIDAYTLVFSASTNMSLSVGMHQWLRQTAITFLAPVWGNSFSAAQTNVTLFYNGSALDLSTPGSLTYSFQPLWYPEPFTPTIGLAVGGTGVTVSGYGFNVEDYYLCRFSYSEEGWLLHKQEVVATNIARASLLCETPQWEFYAKRAAVSLWRIAAPANSAVLGTDAAEALLEVVHSEGNENCFEFLDVWRDIFPRTVGSVSGHTITVLGQGFDPAEDQLLSHPFSDPEFAKKRQYLMVFQAGDVVDNGTCAVLSYQEMHCLTPAWPAAATTANLTIILRWTLWDGYFRRRQERVISTVNANFTSIITIDFAPEWAALEPSYGDKLGGTTVTVHGNGFSSSANYKCNFTGPGISILRPVTYISPTLLTCNETDPLSLVPWDEFATIAATLTLSDGNADFATSGDPSFPFVFINKAPTFTGKNLIVPGGINAQRVYSVPWLLDSSPGAADETSQNVSFIIETLPAEIFVELPSLVGGNLTFQVAGGYVGVAIMRVYVVDEGGTRWGGSNRSATKSFSISILQYDKPSSFVMLPNVTVKENSGFTEVLFFVSDMVDAPHNLLQVQALSLQAVSGDMGVFASDPAVFFNGSLLLSVGEYQNGEIVMTLTLAAVGGGSERSENFTIYILPINQPPSFLFSSEAVANMTGLLENSENHTVHGLVYNVSKGPPVDNEDYQKLSFRVILVDGRSSLFVPFARFEGNCTDPFESDACAELLNSSLVYVSLSGVVSFTLNPFENGFATFDLTLLDDGGTDYDGLDTSQMRRFNISVLAVNSPPMFDIKDVDGLLEGAGSLSLPGIAWNVSAGSPTGDEDNQVLSFLVWDTTNSSLFSSPILLSPNGTLALVLTPYQYGVARLQVQLVDDGMTAYGGSNTSDVKFFNITVLPVNQAPYFDIVPCVELLEGDLHYSDPNFAQNISTGSPTHNEDWQALSFSVVLRIGYWSMFSPSGVSLNTDGSLQLSLAAFEYGTAIFEIVLSDNGGTENGGISVSNPRILNVTVLPVNTPPTFELQSNVSSFEGDGSVLVPGAARSISRGSPIGNEDWQTLTFTWELADGTSSLFEDSRVDLSPDGNLSFRLAPYQNGYAMLNFTLHDSGGTDNGGMNMSQSQMMTVWVTAVNNAPSFDIVPFVRVLVGTNYSENGTVTHVSAGSPTGNEDSQTLSFFLVFVNGSSDLFDTDLSIASDGVISFVASEYNYGWMHFLVTLADDGGNENGGLNISQPQSFAVHVVFVNHPPTFVIDRPNLTVWEDSVTNRDGFATNISKGSLTDSEDWQSLTFVLRLLNSTSPMFDSQNVSMRPDGMLSFTLNPFEHGEATFEVMLYDDGGVQMGGRDSSRAVTFNIIVLPVNTAPTFAVLSNVEVLEGSGHVSIAGVAAEISRGSPNGNEDYQEISFTVMPLNGSMSLFTTPSVTLSSNGTLSFFLEDYEYGVASLVVTLEDSGGTDRFGHNISVSRVLTIRVLPVNDPPAFIGNDQVVGEDGGYTILPGFASNISKGPPTTNEDYQEITFHVFLVSGSLSVFKPFSFANPAHNCVFNETLSNQTISNTSNASVWSSATAWSISTMCSDITTSNTMFNTSKDTMGFSQSQAVFTPAITSRLKMLANGMIAFTLADDEFGSAVLALELIDDGGRDNGGYDTSAQVLVTITVLPVNDAPRFKLGLGDCLQGIIEFGCSLTTTTIILRRNAFLIGQSYTLRNFALGVAPGPPNEELQSLTFEVTHDPGENLLVGDPVVAPDGSLQLTQHPDAVGEARFSLRAVDSGGTDRGGTNVSNYSDFRIVVVSGLVEAVVTLRVPVEDFNTEQFLRNVSGVINVPMERIGLSYVRSVPAGRRLMSPGAEWTHVGLQVFLLTDRPAALQAVSQLLGSLSRFFPYMVSVNSTQVPVDDSDGSMFRLVSQVFTVYEENGQGAHTIDFAMDVFSTAEPYDNNGQQTIDFVVVQANGTNSTKFFSDFPAVLPAVCNRSEPCSTRLSFSTLPASNGEAWFYVRQACSGCALVRVFKIVVLPINQAPEFELDSHLVVLEEDTVSFTWPGFATGISPGPEDEESQALSFDVVAVATSGPLSFDGTNMPFDASMWNVSN